MLVVTVPANDLNRLLENVKLYADKKSVHIREVLFSLDQGTLQVFSCDGYVTITDSIPVSGSTDSKMFCLAVEDLEKFLEWVKEDKKTVHKTVLTLKFKATLFTGESGDFDSEYQVNYARVDQDKWDIILRVLALNHPEITVGRFNLNPARLAKMNQIKADKEAPVTFRWVDINGMIGLQFKKGLTAYGLFQSIEDRYVEEEFLWPNLNQESTEASPS